MVTPLEWSDLADHERTGVQLTVGAFFSIRQEYAPTDDTRRIAFYRQQLERATALSDFTMKLLRERLEEKIERGLL